jgi:hypothetical protein
VTDAAGCKAVEEVYLSLDGGCVAPTDSTLTFLPSSGAVGDIITLRGHGFSTTLTQNIVKFGATNAEVLNLADDVLTVKVPTGATYSTIVMTNNVSGFSTFSKSFFIPTFAADPDATDFDENVDFKTGNTVRNVTISDLDGDRKPDLISVDATGSVTIYKNKSVSGSINAGSFFSGIAFTHPGKSVHVTTGDLNGDGKPELVLTLNDRNSVLILKNESTSSSISFASGVEYSVGTGPTSTELADIDRNGKLDLITLNETANSISIRRDSLPISVGGNLSTTSFSPKFDLSTGILPKKISIADVDGDGKDDFVVANYTSNTLSVYRNRSDKGFLSTASFAPRVDISTGMQDPWSLAIADLDRDDKPDIITANKVAKTVSIFRNKASRGAITTSSFDSRVDVSTNVNNASIGLGDVDGNGKVDISIVPEGTVTEVTVLANTSTFGSITASSFSRKLTFPVKSTATLGNPENGFIGMESISPNATLSETLPQALIVADMDGDGKSDLTLANTGSASVAVLRNDVPTPITYTWVGPSGSAWNNSAHWSPAGIPGSGDIVEILNTSAPILDQSRELLNLKMAANTSLNLSTFHLTLIGSKFENSGTVTGDGHIIMSGSQAQLISGIGIVENLEIKNPDGVSIASGIGNMLTITGRLIPTSGVLQTNDNLTLRSNGVGTARVGVGSEVGGYIFGNVITQRYLKTTANSDRNGRAWRIVTIPVTGTGTLREFFMAGRPGADLTTNTDRLAQPAELGTVIVGHDQLNLAAASTNNLDWLGVSRQVSSLRKYISDVGAGSFASSQVPSMGTSYTDADWGYAVFVRGDRRTDYTATPAISSSTTLQATGTLKQGTQTIIIPPASTAGYVLIGNPFMAVLDMEKVLTDPDNAGILSPELFIWDAHIDGNSFKQGGYRQMVRSVSGSWTYTLGGTKLHNIESGVAFFVKPAAGGNLKLKESHKVNDAPGIIHLGSVTNDERKLYVNLEIIDSAKQYRPVDGVVAFFDSIYRESLEDPIDIKKESNISSGALGILSHGERLAMEGRPIPAVDSVRSISLDLRSTGAGNFRFKIFPSGFDDDGFTMWLKDNVTKKETIIDKQKETLYKFSVTQPTSADITRFSIEYRRVLRIENGTASDVDQDTRPIINVYPNPSNGSNTRVIFSNIQYGDYQLDVSNLAGKRLLKFDLKHQSKNMRYEIPGFGALSRGVYVMTITQNGKIIQSLKFIIQ